MGSRGAFINIDKGNFCFVENGQHYETIGEIEGTKILIQKIGAVKAPEFSHSKNAIYAIVQGGTLKHLTFYDENHRQFKSIDFCHPHGINKLQPHIHYNLIHNKNELGIPPSADDLKLAKKIKKAMGVK